MLQELDIDSYAVVDRLRVRFHSGLNLLTGETGSGKSIVVDSLALLFGARASADLVRAGSQRARVSGIFNVPGDEPIRALLAESGIENEDDELIIERQVLSTGKSRAYVNGSPATLNLLKELAPFLGDIHGQHEQQILLSPKNQLEMLDAFASTVQDVRDLRAIYNSWHDAESRLKRLNKSEQERLRRIDLLQFQVDEIENAGLQAYEEEDLHKERGRLLHMGSLQEGCNAVYNSLYDSDTSVSVQIKNSAQSLDALTSLEESFEQFAKSLEEARNTIEDIAYELSNYLDRLEAEPARQEELEARLALIETLKRKYGPTLEDVIGYGEKIGKELEDLNNSVFEIEQLEKLVEESSREYRNKARSLSMQRMKAAERLREQVKQVLAELALAKSDLVVEFKEQGAWGATGLDRITLCFTANPGQPLRPLSQVASGGELSRVALALKTCLEKLTSEGSYRRTLVFDEIDSGVGGSAAEAIGRRLKQVSVSNQLICVTHLPQIARFADVHYLVSKTEEGQQTNASLEELSNESRVEELARMLSGAEVTEAALANARQLLELK